MSVSFANLIKKKGWAKRGLPAALLGLGILLAAFAILYKDAMRNSLQNPAASYEAPTQDVLDASQTLPPATGGGFIGAMDYRFPVDAPLRGDPNARSSALYDAVIDQFEVEKNPRYRLGKRDMRELESGGTYCNIFVWDVTRAMGAEIPYWVRPDREKNEPEVVEDGRWELWLPTYWLSANGFNQWLNEMGPLNGWHEVSAEEAQDVATLGHPTVVSWYNPYQRDGHIGIVRPGDMHNGPALAQAGTTNVNYAHVYDFFPREGTQFFVHD